MTAQVQTVTDSVSVSNVQLTFHALASRLLYGIRRHIEEAFTTQTLVRQRAVHADGRRVAVVQRRVRALVQQRWKHIIRLAGNDPIAFATEKAEHRKKRTTVLEYSRTHAPLMGVLVGAHPHDPDSFRPQGTPLFPRYTAASFFH